MQRLESLIQYNMEKCKFCGGYDLTYHQYFIMDSVCSECGEWQDGNTIQYE